MPPLSTKSNCLQRPQIPVTVLRHYDPISYISIPTFKLHLL